jgi:hypothetical protein
MSSSTPVPAPKTNERVMVPQSAVQSGAERVFVTHPRLFSFSSRSLSSLRHPYLPIAVSQADADLAKVKRQFQTKGERLADILAPTAPSYKFEEERWNSVGFMLDSIAFEEQIAARREAVLASNSTVRALEALWAHAVGSPGGTLSQELYNRMHVYLYEKLTGSADPVLAPLVQAAIDADWQLDRSEQGVEFGVFFISFLEIADNWVPLRDAEAYAAFLTQAFAHMFAAAPPRDAEAKPGHDAKVTDGDYGQLLESIRDYAQTLEHMTVIQCRRNAAGQTVYEPAHW